MIELTNNSEKRYKHLNGLHALRGFAAIIVFLFHLHHMANIYFPPSWSIISDYGGRSVQLFFVLSAFSLCYSNKTIFKISKNKSNWLIAYYLKRFFRVAPLFYFMLLVYCLEFFFIRNNPIEIYRIFINILFLFNLVPNEAEEIVIASWTIGVEVIFYIIFPLILMSIRSIKHAAIFWILITFSSFCFRIALEHNTNVSDIYRHFAFMSQFGVFSGGILGYWIFCTIVESERIEIKTIYCKFILFVFGPLLGIALCSPISQFMFEFHRIDIQFLGLSFGIITALLAKSNHFLLRNKVTQYLGDRSYSIYLVHPLVLVWMTPTLQKTFHFLQTSLGLLSFTICIIMALLITLLFSELTYRLVELKGIELSKRFIKKFGTLVD